MIAIPNTDVMTGFTFTYANKLHTVIGFCTGTQTTPDHMLTTFNDDDGLQWPCRWENSRRNEWNLINVSESATVLDLIVQYFNRTET